MTDLVEAMARVYYRAAFKQEYGPGALDIDLENGAWRKCEPGIRAILAKLKSEGLKIVGREPAGEAATMGLIRLGVMRNGEPARRDEVNSVWRTMWDAAP